MPPFTTCRRRATTAAGAFEPARLAVEQLFHALVRFRGQQRLAGFEEVAVVLDLPEVGVHRDPLRGKRTRVRSSTSGKYSSGQPVADVRFVSLVRKQKFARAFTSGRLISCL